jgi:enterochelin esterase-like enzyme
VPSAARRSQAPSYHSGIVGDDRDFYLYTPPGYDGNGRKSYPVLYLLHGFSDAVDRFAWIGAYSSGGIPADEFSKSFPSLDAKANAQLRLLWIACGKEDRLIDGNRKFLDWLKSKDVRHTWVETPGAHTWMVWRRYLAEFAPLLFQDKTS